MSSLRAANKAIVLALACAAALDARDNVAEVQLCRSDGAVPEVLLIDLAGNGIQLQSPRTGPSFSVLGGQVVRTGWTVAQTDDAFVVVEQQRNGRIDGLSELLGCQGPPNGFDYLRALDGTVAADAGTFGRGANRRPDGVIDRSDAVFDRLVFWTDSNANGRSDDQELQSASFAGVSSIELTVADANRELEGNEITQTARAVRVVAGKPREIAVAAVRLTSTR